MTANVLRIEPVMITTVGLPVTELAVRMLSVRRVIMEPSVPVHQVMLVIH